MLILMKRNFFGYTLLEIMITLIIAAGIIAMGIITLQNYIPRQRLLDSLETVEQTLNRAQFEANSRSVWTCIAYDNSTKTLTVYADMNANHDTGGITACGDGGDLPLTTQSLRQGVTFAPFSDKSFSFSPRPLWFDSTGVPKDCNAGVCSPISAQIIVTDSELATATRAREVEALSSGLIATVDRGAAGYVGTLFAKTATMTGSGACE
jgi:type II secretory pathway pseudopilin PulG